MAFLSQTFKALAASAFLAPSLAAADPLFSGGQPNWEMMEDRYATTRDLNSGCVEAPADRHDGLLVYNLDQFSSVAIDKGETVRLQYSIPTGTGSRAICEGKSGLHGDIPSGLSGLKGGLRR